MHDASVNGETVRGLPVKDEASVYALAIDIARSFRANDVMAIVLRLFRRYELRAFCARTLAPSSSSMRSKGGLTNEVPNCLHRAWQALAEWRERELQQNLPKRSKQR